MAQKNIDIFNDIPDFSDIHRAFEKIRGQLRQTPVLNDPALDMELDCTLFNKCEHLQRTGAFKFRGASHAVYRLREQNIEGDVATHSSGNHGAALALAARLDGRRAHVVMPENASSIKIAAVQNNGGVVHFCQPTQAAREHGLAVLLGQGHIPIPPYDHADIIAGQGTACLELLQQVPQLDAIVVPIGGGGLISGSAIVARHFGVEVFGAEPDGAADTAASLSLGQRVESWQPDTIADGLRALVGIRNFAVIQKSVKNVFTVAEDAIRMAMLQFWRHTRMIIEPSSAVAIAAIQAHPEVFAGRKTGAIITGANIHPADWLALTRQVS